MTSNISSNNFSILDQNWKIRGNMKQYHWLALMTFVLLALCTSIPALMQWLDSVSSGQNSSPVATYLLLDNGFLNIVSMASAFVMGISLFRYLNSKPEVDFFHSLPVPSQTQFLQRYSLGLLFFIVPLFFHGFLTYAVCILGDFDNIPPFYLFMSKWLEISALFFSIYNFTCLGTILTGNNFMAICTSVGFANAPSALVAVQNALCHEFWDYYQEPWDMISTVSRYTNPFSVLMFAINAGVGHYFLQGLVLFPLCYLCFQKRPSENSSNPVALENWKLVIKGLGVVCGASIMGLLFMNLFQNYLLFYLLGAFIMASILHVAFEMLFDMDIRAGFLNKRHFLVLYGMVALFAIIIVLDLGKYDQRLEPLEKISSINWNSVTLESPENLEILHKTLYNHIAEEQGVWVMLESANGSMYGEKRANGESTKISLNSGANYERNYGYLRFSREDYFALTTSREYLLQSHNYDLSSQDFLEIQKEISSSKSYSQGFSVDFQRGNIYLSTDTVEEIYALILRDLELLTPSYLEDNSPVLYIFYYGSDKYFHIPVYEIHQEALDLIHPTQTHYQASELRLTVDMEEMDFISLPTGVQEEIYEKMTVVYNDYGKYSSIGTDWSQKDFVKITNYGSLVGYLPYEEYLDILAKE